MTDCCHLRSKEHVRLPCVCACNVPLCDCLMSNAAAAGFWTEAESAGSALGAHSRPAHPHKEGLLSL